MSFLGSGSSSSSIGALPSDFFSLTGEEVKREQRERTDVVERESMLRTKVRGSSLPLRGPSLRYSAPRFFNTNHTCMGTVLVGDLGIQNFDGLGLKIAILYFLALSGKF